MAIRREDERREEWPDSQGAERDELRAIGQERVREDVLAIGRRVIAEDRMLLQRLAEYDQGKDAGR